MAGQRQRFCLTAAICIVGICSASLHSETARTHQPTASNIAADVVTRTNAERTDRGRTPLRANPRLMRAAQIHAEQMAHASQMAHDLPNATYPTTADRLAAAHYRWQMYGENVAQGQSDAVQVVRSWMDSSGHRKNILNPGYREIGAGFAVDRVGRPYFVQVFGRPAS